MKLRPAALVLALAASSFAWGKAADLPARIAYLGYVEGDVTFQAARGQASSALPERLLRPGDRLATERDGRAELSLGTAIIRLDEGTKIVIVHLDETRIRVELNAGVASIHLGQLYEGETFEIAMSNTTVELDAPGEYRVEVRAEDATALIVREGAATLTTAGGLVRVASGQRVRIEGRDAVAQLVPPLPADTFDDWVLDREVQLAAAEPPFEAPVPGYVELSHYGSWYMSSYGYVWSPFYTGSGWAPYHHGHWRRDGYGWSWNDSAPWGVFSFHSGQWAFLYEVGRWCWVPGPRGHGGAAAQETHPFGRPRGHANSRLASLPADADADGRARRPSFTRSFGGSSHSRSAASTSSWSGGSTMRRSGSSFGRGRSTSGTMRRGGSIYATSGSSLTSQ